VRRIADLHSVSVLPQPVVTQIVPGRMVEEEPGRQMGETWDVICTGLDNFTSVTSLLNLICLL